MTFRECDDNQDNFISTRELGWAMRVMGHNPTEAELQELANRVSISSRASNEGFQRLRFYNHDLGTLVRLIRVIFAKVRLRL